MTKVKSRIKKVIEISVARVRLAEVKVTEMAIYN